ncbi:MAG: hypothetical protein ACRC92_24025 [Peptostreptococcaceae bacterium]
MMNLLDNTTTYLDIVKNYDRDIVGALAYQSDIMDKKSIFVGGVECDIMGVVIREKTSGLYSVVVSVDMNKISVEVR